MPRRLVPPTSELPWGKLVKSWATGKNYFDPTKPAPALPKTRAKFLEMCAEFGVEIDLPDFIQAVVFVQPSREALTIRLPPAEIVASNEVELAAPGSVYMIPAFYDDFYGIPLNVPEDRKLEFHALRIGDYSISMCV